MKHPVLYFFLGLAVLHLGCRHLPDSPNDLDSGGPLEAAQAAFDVQDVAIDLSIHPQWKSIKGRVLLTANAVKPLSELVLNLDQRMRVKHVFSPTDIKSSLAFKHQDDRLVISLPKPAVPGERIAVSIHYKGRPRAAIRAPWDGGFTWAKTDSGHPWIATTVQGEGADLWWPCKDHPSDKPESITLRIRVPEPLVVAANGRLESVIENADRTRTYHWRTEMPISNYNVALNIGPYETIEGTFESIGGETVPVTYWVLPENRGKGEKLFREFTEHLAFYERFLGPYPFRAEKYGVAETPHLGMEHQTIIAYGNEYKGGPHGYDWLHHHELGHEWWGNLVTAKDWRHFWIHEGFCTYMQALYAEEREGIMAYHHAMYAAKRRIKNRYAIVPADPVGMAFIGSRVGNDAYYKGSWVLHMLRYLMGDQAFFAFLRRMAYPDDSWETRTDGSACRFVETQDVIDLAKSVSGMDLDWFFDFYLRQPELPELLAEQKEDGLHLRWKVPEAFPFPMPVEVKINGEIRRIAMPDGTGIVNGAGKDVRLDPFFRILKSQDF